MREPVSPEKARARGGRASPRHTTHKSRARWFQERACYPFVDVNPEPVVDCRGSADQPGFAWSPARSGRWKWEELGPENIGGRLTSLFVHPEDESVLVAGAAAGGVWRSANGGSSWELFWNDPRTLNIGSLAYGKEVSGRLFLLCGTGEANLSADNYPGIGVFRCSGFHPNRKPEWKLIAPANITGLPIRIGVLAVNPRNPDHILLGGVTHLPEQVSGLYASFDGGLSWSRQRNGDATLISGRNYFCHAIVFHPTEDVVFAAVNAKGPLSGIWRSTDCGRTWAQLETGLPPGEEFGRASLAIAGSTRRLYALAEDGREGILGVYRSDDLGDSWKEIGGRHFRNEAQLSYNNCIAVHPRDPDFVICGGVDLHRTRDGGTRWARITNSFAPAKSGRRVHSDHHVVVITPKGTVYTANDGGLDVSVDGGNRWKNRSRGLRITMFYDLDVAPDSARCFGGGTQDNGTIVTRSGDRPGRFKRELEGDGGFMIYSPEDHEHIIGSYQQAGLQRHTRIRGWIDIRPRTLSEREGNQVWIARVAMDRTEDAKLPRRLILGTTRVWASVNDGRDWAPISKALDGTVISALEILPADPDHVLVGTTKGGIYRGSLLQRRWSPNLAGPELPGTIVTRIAGHPADPRIVLATVGGAPRPAAPLPPDAGAVRSWPRVYRSFDGGRTWSGAYTGPQLPDIPHHSVAFDQVRPERVFVSNDAGVFVSDNLGQNWENIGSRLPPVLVMDLVVHRSGGRQFLYAATYGRGIWRLKI